MSRIRLKSLLVALGVLGLVLGGAGGAQAGSKKFPTTVTIDSAAGSHVEGTIDSKKDFCVQGRSVDLKRGSEAIGTATADADGAWSSTLSVTLHKDDVIKAKADKIHVQVNEKRKTCDSGSDTFVVTEDPPPATNQLVVSVTGPGAVNSNPAGITACKASSGTCEHDFTAGTSVELTQTADAGATFTAWGGDCTGSGTTCTVIMSADKTVTATFAAGPVDTCPVPTNVPEPIRGVLCLIAETLGG